MVSVYRAGDLSRWLAQLPSPGRAEAGQDGQEMGGNQKSLWRHWGFPSMPQSLQAELSPSPRRPVLAAKVGRFWLLKPPRQLPPPRSPGLVLIFSHLSTFSACSPVSWQAVNQSQACVAGEDAALEGWGGIISAAKETTLACALCRPLCTLYTSLCRHSCCLQDFSSTLGAARGWTRTLSAPGVLTNE